MDWSDLIQGTLEDYQKLPQAKDLHWDIQLVPHLVVAGDEALLHRVLGNYLDNALKFTQSRIGVSLAAKEDHAVLSVSDDGIGIPPDKQQEIWDRLVQLDPSRNKNRNQGLGLGLSFVATVAKLLKGQAGVKSVPGKGSTFTFSLLLKKS